MATEKNKELVIKLYIYLYMQVVDMNKMHINSDIH